MTATTWTTIASAFQWRGVWEEAFEAPARQETFHSAASEGAMVFAAAPSPSTMACAVGGGSIRRHNRVARWLAGWLSQERAPGEVLLEQRVYQENGIMDITVAQAPRTAWIDVAIVSPSSACRRMLRQRAKTDGAAARDEEGIKRRRYGGRVDPFVVECGGRPGRSARSILMRYAAEDATLSQEIGHAWQSVSTIVQSETSRSLLSAWGGQSALNDGKIEIYTP